MKDLLGILPSFARGQQMLDKPTRILGESNWRDAPAAVGFLQLLRPTGPWTVTAIYVDDAMRVDGDVGNAPTRTFDDSEGLREWIEARNGRANLYYTANGLKQPMNKKPAATDIRLFEFAHVDIDCDKSADGAAGIDAWKEIARTGLELHHPRPSFIVDTAGGLQALWRLSDPKRLKTAKDIERAKSVNRSLVNSLGGDLACVNPAHLLRLPGTVNIPGATKRKRGRVVAPARLVRESEATCPVAAFPADTAPREPTSAPETVPAVEADGQAPVADERRTGEINPEQLGRLLDVLDPADFGDYAEWQRLVYSCHSATGGAAEGRKLVVTFCRQIEGYDTATGAKETTRLWNNAKAGKAGGATIGTLIEYVIQAGGTDIVRQVMIEAEFDDGFTVDDVVDDGFRHGPGGLRYRMGTDIKMRPINWLWRHRIARGKLTNIAGDPEASKTTFVLAVSALCTTGGPWPDGGENAPTGTVIFLTAEDDPEDTIVPRFVAAGGDPAKFIVLESAVREMKGKKLTQSERMLNLNQDLRSIEQLIKAHPDTVLLCIDPVTAFMGTTKTIDASQDSDIRSVMGPVKNMAERLGIACIGIMHFGKDASGRKAMHRVLGSIAFVGLARSNWVVFKEVDEDGEATGRRLFAKAKQNIGPDNIEAVAYNLEGTTVDGIEAVRVAWDGTVEGDADALLRAESHKAEKPKLTAAKQFLQDQLKDGPRLTREINRAAKEAGHSEKTLQRAGEELRVIREQFAVEGEPRPVWHMRLREPGDDFDDDLEGHWVE